MTELSDIEFSPYKWSKHIGKLQALAEGRDVSPVTVELDLVDYCNHRCGWCVDPNHGSTEMDVQLAIGILRELREMGVEGVVFKGGGEPTLHRHFSDLVADARRLEFEAGVVTNGSRLLQHAKVLAEYASYVRISVDGPTPADHKEIHGSSDFNDIVRGIADLVSVRADRRHPVIGLSFAVEYSRRHTVETALKLGMDLGVDYVLLRPPFFEEVGRANRMSVDEKAELFDVFERERARVAGKIKVFIDYWVSDTEAGLLSAKASPRRGARSGTAGNGIEHEMGRCLASPLMAVIAADGQIYPCCNLRGLQEWSIGKINYADGRTFQELWNSDRRRQVKACIESTSCIASCTHPLSKYNEIIEYLRTPQFHGGFV